MPLVSYATVGQALGALGEAVTAQGAQGAVAGRYLSAAGSYFEGIQGAVDTTVTVHC